MTVLPPLFDSRQNFARDKAGKVTNLGQDYGYYQSDEFEGLDRRGQQRRPTRQPERPAHPG